METRFLQDIAKLTTGKLNSNAAVSEGKYLFFTCAPEPLRIDEYRFDGKAILLAGNNAEGNFHISYYEGKFNAYQRTYVITTRDENVTDIKYLYYALMRCLSQFKIISQGTATKFLTAQILNHFDIPFPDIDTQRKISRILATLEEKAKNNERINKNLEEQAEAIFKSWFLDYEPFDGTMPEDWIQGVVDDLASDVVCGKTPSTKKKEYYGSDVPFITIPDMHNCVYALQTERMLSNLGADSQSKKTLPKNSICVSCIGTAGLVTLVPYPSQTNQQINSIIPREGFSSFYIYLLMQTKAEIINRLGQSGSTIVNLNKAQFGKIPVIMPALNIMKKFDDIVAPLFEMILANQEVNVQLALTRDLLLPTLMSGELDVSDLDL